MTTSDVFPFWRWAQNNGGGNIVFVWYCAGMPWAATSGYLNPLSLDDDHRRRMFGWQSVNTYPSGAPAASYKADDVFMIQALRVPGNQTINVVDTVPFPSGGRWTVEIDNVHPGISWTHNNSSREIWGIEGLNTIPNAVMDNEIRGAELAATLNVGDTALYIQNDYGDRLRTDITLNDDPGEKPTTLWVGNECMMTTGAIVDDGDQAFHVNVARGIYKTVNQAHFVGTIGAKPIAVADAPLGGIGTGRPCYLYAIVTDSDGNIIDDAATRGTEIAMIRDGKVGSRVERRGPKFTIACDPWWTFLDQKIKKESAQANLRGFYFTRGGDGSDDADKPHLSLWEWDNNSTPQDWKQRKIWLCLAGAAADTPSSVFFETKADVIEALRQELLTCYIGAGTFGSDQVDYLYEVLDDGIHHQPSTTPVPNSSKWSYLMGPIPWLLNLNHPNSESYTLWIESIGNYSPILFKGSVFNRSYARRCYSQSGQATSSTEYDSDANVLYSAYTSWVGNDELYAAQYAYQFDWDEESWSMDDGSFGLRTFDHPMPGKQSIGGSSIYLNWESDVDNFADTTTLLIGSWNQKVGDGNGGYINTMSKTLVSSITGASNKINLSNQISVFSTQVGIPRLRHVSSSDDNDADKSPFRIGGFLYYLPHVNSTWSVAGGGDGGDIWPVHQSDTYSSPKLSNIFRALLGDTGSTLTIPETFQFSSIPNSKTTTVNGETEFVSSIDWTSFDNVCEKMFDGQYYRINVDDDVINLKTLMTESLKLHGGCATWEYVASVSQYQMKFRNVGVVSSSSAQIEGRTLDLDDTELYAVTDGEHSGDKVISGIAAQFNYDPADDEYKIKLNVQDGRALAASGNKDVTLAVEDILTYVPSYDPYDEVQNTQMQRYFIEHILAKMAWPMPAQSTKGTLKAIIETPVGASVLVTSATAEDQFTGAPGLTAAPALITGLSIDYSKASTKVNYRVSPEGSFDFAPACRITAVTEDGNDVTVTVFDLHRYSNLATRNDLSFFGNFSYNDSTGILTREDATVYQVTLCQEDGGPVIEDVECLVDSDSLGAVLTKTGLAASYDSTKDYVMIYADYDNASLAAAQRKWLYFAEEDGLIDNGTTDEPGDEWE